MEIRKLRYGEHISLLYIKALNQGTTSAHHTSHQQTAGLANHVFPQITPPLDESSAQKRLLNIISNSGNIIVVGVS